VAESGQTARQRSLDDGRIKTSGAFIMASFQLVGLPAEPFAELFDLSDAELAAHHAQRVVASAQPGYPCRVSLVDADVDDELLLLTYPHQPAASPYKASGPIYVRRGALQRKVEAGLIPDCVRSRLMSVRAYDAAHMIVDASVCEGSETGAEIRRLFGNDKVAYIHLHNAKRGCFSCRVDRV
jgi:Protein of unknown function (DUF1203)